MTAPPVDEHRTDLELLLNAAAADLAASWVEDDDPGVIRDALARLMPDLLALYGSAAATLGADWYDDMRDLASVPGGFRAIPAELPDQDALDALVGWGTQPLWPYEREVEDDDGNLLVEIVPPDIEAAKTRVDGGFQKLVADMDRNTVIGSLIADPQAHGWSRQTTGKSCDFCVMLAGRGAVYSAETADFSSHNNCDCIAVPVFGGDSREVKLYVPSQKFKTDEQRAANNKRVRDYLNKDAAPTGRTGRRRTSEPAPARDVDADRTIDQLRATLATLERSLTVFDSPGTRVRVADLRRKIAART